ncbi:MAG: sigma-70 family RNA polymerase sigma factor [Verrucomicrobiota bacterium]
MERSDRDLIDHYLRKGDTASVRELLGRYEDRLHRYLWQMLRHHQDCEDALQESFRKALKALPNYHEESHFKSWLFRIGHNTALDMIRRRKKIVELDGLDGSDMKSGDEQPREAIEAKEQAEAVRRAVDDLPAHEREVVSLRMQADLSFREIAQAIGVPLGTVLGRMHKAKQRLRTKLSTT